jgi:hypothetical protein
LTALLFRAPFSTRPGLIDPLGFLRRLRRRFPAAGLLELGLTVYDLLALRWEHNYYGHRI